MLRRRTTLIGLLCCVFLFTACVANQEKNRKMAKGHREVGLAYLSDGNPTFALRELLKAEELKPDDYMTQYGLGIAYMSKDATDRAIVHFEKAIELKPDYAPATNSLGAAYMKKKRWDDAIRVFKQLTTNLLYSTPHFPLYNIGRAYYFKKDYTASEAYYVKALKYYNDGFTKDFTYIRVLRGLAQTNRAMEQLDKAEEYLLRATKYAPNLAPLYLDLARLNVQQGRYRIALENYQKVIDLDPDGNSGIEAQAESRALKSPQQ
jgi:Tfp pilus assembly protein PilF